MRFIDLFVKMVESKRDNILRIIIEPDERIKFYNELVKKYWYPLPITRKLHLGCIYAIDSSDAIIELAGGGVIYIARSAGISNHKDELREINLDALYPKFEEDLNEYRKLMREHLEHKVALKAANKLGDSDVILIDGSIFGRMSHVFMPINILGREDFMVKYVELFYELLETCIEKNILLVGVAKDSRSTLFKEAFLTELLLNKISNYENEMKLKIESIIPVIFRNPRDAIKLINELQGKVNVEVIEILRELLDPLPDTKIIISTKLKAGYSHPLKLTFKRLVRGYIEGIFKPEKRFEIARKFLNSLPTSFNQDIEMRVQRALKYMALYPPVASFYVKFKDNDLPLRIDVVHDEIYELESYDKVPFIAGDWEGIIGKVISILSQLYAGLRNYNVLLTMVDNYVKFRREHKEKYKAMMEKILGILVEQSRGARRVSFP
ncbi:MAG: DNA double-strand break repair nuclease NurA [Candidatus Njordarchaeales archaeon]